MSKNPVLNPFAHALGTPDSLMGFVAAASTIPGILVSLPAGSLSDIFGRKKLLLVSGTVFATAPFLYLIVDSWWQLALVRFYHGFATAMFVPITNAYVAEMFPTKKAERISVFSSATTVGRTLAPFLGGYILFVTNYGFQQLYLAVGVAGVTSLVTALILLKEKRHSVGGDFLRIEKHGSRPFQGWTLVARNPGVLIVSLVEAAQYYVYGAVEFFLVGYLMQVAHFDSLSFGVISGAQLATVPLLKPLTGKLSDRIGRRIPIATGSVISALSLIVIPLTTDFGLLLMISILYGFGFSMATASTPALTSELVGKQLVGTGMGFLSTIMDVGQALGPIVTGVILASSFGYFGSFASFTLILLATCSIFVAARIRTSAR
jgi:MFS family permease